MSQLDAELEHAGEETALSPKMLLLEQLRITPEKQLKPMEFLFHLYGMPCFPRRELVAITGKAKSGKTFVTSMLMACCQSRDVLAFQRIGDEPLRVLWYDTEQSDESTQDILKNRIMTLIKTTTDLTDSTDKNSCNSCNSLFKKSIDVFNVRGVAWKERRGLLKEAVTRYGPDLVIVDGIRDLVNDINDGVLAQEVMEELMQLAADQNCCIVGVLHQNKGSEDHNLRGWIGTELMNKAFEVYACEKLLPQRVFKVEQTLTRKYDIEQAMYFEVNGDGLPVSCAEPDSHETVGQRQERLPPLNQTYIVRQDDGTWSFNVQRLFNDALRGEDMVQAHEYRERVMKLSGISVPYTYNAQLTKAIEQKVIEKVVKGKLTYYRAAPF